MQLEIQRSRAVGPSHPLVASFSPLQFIASKHKTTPRNAIEAGGCATPQLCSLPVLMTLMCRNQQVPGGTTHILRVPATHDVET
ncbi:hypothetical protein MN608_05095 [Microdochium nivale]|nr:hypothetical protein MN608_05095 [Microdochium nivale]